MGGSILVMRIKSMDARLPMKLKRENEYAAGRPRNRHRIVLKVATIMEFRRYLGYFDSPL